MPATAMLVGKGTRILAWKACLWLTSAQVKKVMWNPEVPDSGPGSVTGETFGGGGGECVLFAEGGRMPVARGWPAVHLATSAPLLLSR